LPGGTHIAEGKLMRNKHVDPEQQVAVSVTLICDRYGAAACATSPLDPAVKGTGIAKKEPGDPNSWEIAVNLAVGGALEDLGRQMRETGTEQVAEAMAYQSEAKVRSALRRSNLPQHPERILLPLAEIKKEYGKDAVKVAARRRGVEWPPKKKAKK